MNIWDDGWDDEAEHGRFAYRRRRIAFGRKVGASVWEIPPGRTQLPYHFHHAQEELLVVLRGRPTLRSPEGERQLAEGEAVHFGLGPDGAHSLANTTDEPVRILFVSNLEDAEVGEYPDSGRVRVLTRGDSQRGARLATQFRLDDEVAYFEGESPGD